jgi:Holliday junction resolvase RusA-like endonuclease
LRVRIYGTPVPWARARAKSIGPGIRFFESAGNVDWKRTVIAQTLAVWDRGGPAPKLLAGPLSVRMIFYLPRPKSAPKRVVHHLTKPDVSNLVKIVEDALNGVVWYDDKQIVRLVAEKMFDERPGVELEVQELGATTVVAAKQIGGGG